MKQLLEDFKCKDYKELNKEGAFKMMLINICEYRKETYRYWKPTKKGFLALHTTECVWHRFNVLYTLLYVWCDFKSQNLIIKTNPFSFFLSEGKLI